MPSGKPQRRSLNDIGAVGRPIGAAALFTNTTRPPTELDPREILPNPWQPRRRVEAEPQAELEASVRDVGIIEPVVVQWLPDGRFRLIGGKRRCDAAIKVGLQMVPVAVKICEDKEARRMTLEENVQRQDLSFDEEAESYQALKNEYNYTNKEIAEFVHKSVDTIENMIAAAQNPPVMAMYMEGRIRQNQIRATIKQLREQAEHPNGSDETTDDNTAEQHPNRSDETTASSRQSAGRPRRPHNAYRPLIGAVTTLARLGEARQRMDNDERRQAREYVLKVREAADRYLDEPDDGN